jgi:hypothetical protein
LPRVKGFEPFLTDVTDDSSVTNEAGSLTVVAGVLPSSFLLCGSR